MNEENIIKLKTFKIQKNDFHAVLTTFENGISLYIYDENPRLGIIGISVPSTSIMPTSTVYVTGTAEDYRLKLIGERLATKLQKMVLISLSLREFSNDVLVELIKKIESELLDKESDNLNDKQTL